MAKRRTKKRARTVSRMSDGRAKRKTARRRKSRRGKGLGDVFTPGGAKQGLKAIATGALGGGLALGADLVTGKSELGKAALTIVPAFAAAAMGYEKLGSGMMGGYVYGALQRLGRESGMLSDDFRPADYADDDTMSETPDALTEDGVPLFLAEDGNFYLSDEFRKTDDGTYVLSDSATPYNSQLAVANY